MAPRKIWGFKVLFIYSIFCHVKICLNLKFDFTSTFKYVWSNNKKDTICTLKLKAPLCNVHKDHIKVLRVQQTGK